MEDFVILIARLFMGIPFIIWGIMKLRGGEVQLVPLLSKLGLPDPKMLAWLVGICELVGGLGIVLGIPVRLFAVALALWCLATAYEAHRKDINGLLSHVTMAGGFFLLAASGAGTLRVF